MIASVPARWRRPLRLLGIYLAYQAFVFALTWPALARLTTHGIGGPDRGGYDHVWYVWWAKQAFFTDLKLAFTPYLCYPDGYETFDTFHNVLHEVAEQPLHLILPHAAVFNLVILVAMAMAGLFTYLCARIFVESRAACFVAGVFYLVAPVIWCSLNNGESELSTYYWVPLDFLLLYRMTERRSWAWAIAAGVALAGSNYASWYFGIEMLLFALIYVSVRIVQAYRSEGWQASLKLFLLGAAAAATCLAIVAHHALFLRNHMHESYVFVQDIPNIEAFFWPGTHGPTEIPGVPNRVGEVEFYNVYYISWVLILLGVYGFATGKLKDRRLLLGIALVFFVFSAGKFLRWGHRADTFDGYIVPLPLMLLYQIRLFRGIHKSFRWIVLVRLMLAILAAGGLAKLAGRSTRRQLVVHGIALVVFVLEFTLVGIQPATMPLETFDVRPEIVPDAYQVAKDDPDDVAMLLLPASDDLRAVSRYLFYQTHHEKKLVGPLAPLFPPWIQQNLIEQYLGLMELYGRMAYVADGSDVAIETTRQEIAATGVRYVVYHPQMEGFQAIKLDMDTVRDAALRCEVGADGSEICVMY